MAIGRSCRKYLEDTQSNKMSVEQAMDEVEGKPLSGETLCATCVKARKCTNCTHNVTICSKYKPLKRLSIADQAYRNFEIDK